MQKPVFYIIVGASVLAAGLALGFSSSRYFSLKYYSPPASPAARGEKPAAGGSATSPPERWANIFAPAQGMDIPSRIAGKAKQAEEASVKPYVLLGTISSEVSASRRAILWADGLKEPRMVRENGEIEPGLRLAKVERDHVMLLRGKRQERLELLPVGSKSRLPAGSSSPSAARGAAPSAAGDSSSPAGAALRVSQIGEGAYSMDEASVNQLTGNINQYMTQVRIVPYFEGNKSAGYRIAAIRPGTAFDQLGFKGGDVIQQINSVELTTPEKLYTIFQNLKDEKRVTVNVLRQGIKSTLTYEIR